MQQQQQQQQRGGGGGGGGSQFGMPQPERSPFSSPRPPMGTAAEAASPISIRPPPPQFEELSIPSSAAGGASFDDEALVAGEEGERGGTSGNRWPRQETLALLKIRSEMDGAFRDATLKGPLWEDVSRKLAELGYKRSAKKCKEKFENVHKYYKRTKDNRAGRPDGKTYRFFSQLEALQAGAPSPTTPTSAATAVMTTPSLSTPISITPTSMAAGPFSIRPPPTTVQMAAATILQPMVTAAIPTATTTTTATMPVGVSFSNTSESEDDDSDDEDTEDMGGGGGTDEQRGKRKRMSGSAGGGGGGKMMRFFEGLMKQVMERQEAMQQRFLETIEKREQDRMIHEEAWRRQEMARLAREQEALAQERSMAASRDAAVISFIQKITGQTIPLPSIAAPAITVIPPPPAQPAPTPPQQQQAPPQPQQQPPPPTQQQQQQKSPMPQQQQRHRPPQQHQSMDLVPVPDKHDQMAGGGFESGSLSSSRWPKAEVHALIQMRSNLENRYEEAGPKGPLWEEISAGMRRMGYNRSSKRCKEKWENINKYFKKVKESNKKRPEDSKTCPYFHQLDALYRSKALTGSGGLSIGTPRPQGQEVNANANNQESTDSHAITAPPLPSQVPQNEAGNKNGNNGGGNNGNRNGGGGSDGGGGATAGMQIPTSNGGATAGFLEEGGGMAMKKPGDFVKELMGQRQQQAAMDVDYDKMDDGADSDDLDDEFDDDDDEEDDDGKIQYEIQFQRAQNVRPNNVSGPGNGSTPSTTAPSGTSTSGSFLAMVQ